MGTGLLARAIGVVLLFFTVTSHADPRWANDMSFWRWYDGQYYGLHHSSTLEEGVLRGYGEYVRSLGAYHVARSIAAKHYQEAYSLYLKNLEEATRTYYERKRIHEEYVKENRRKPLSPEKLAELAKKAAPARLLPAQWNESAKTLVWPMLLKREEFVDARNALNRLFAERFANPEFSGAGSKNCEEVAVIVEEAMEDLRQILGAERTPAAAYVPAKKFLETLKHEARF